MYDSLTHNLFPFNLNIKEQKTIGAGSQIHAIKPHDLIQKASVKAQIVKMNVENIMIYLLSTSVFIELHVIFIILALLAFFTSAMPMKMSPTVNCSWIWFNNICVTDVVIYFLI